MTALEGVIPLFSGRIGRGLPKAGWTNQDLADLYRIESALIQAGLQIDTARGESDEEDPWFVFCRPDTGDVLIHVARIDGEYVIASAGASLMLTGRSFTHIVKDFMAREPSFLLSNRRQNNVLIHPSSVLIAIFATLCVINQEAEASMRASSSELAAKAGTQDNHYDLIPQLLSFALDSSRGGSSGQSADTIFTSHNAFIILSSIAFASFTGASHLLTLDLDLEEGFLSDQDGQEILLASLGDMDIQFDSDKDISSQDQQASVEQAEENIVALHPEMAAEDASIVSEHEETSNAHGVSVLTEGSAESANPAPEMVDAGETISVSIASPVEATVGEEAVSKFYLPDLMAMLSYVDSGQLSFDLDNISSLAIEPPVVMPGYLDMEEQTQSFSYYFEAFAEEYTDSFYIIHDETYYVFQSQAMVDEDLSQEDAFIYTFEDGSSITFVGISQEQFFDIA